MSKYVVTGGAGNVSRPLTEILLKAGNDVTVISRNPDNIGYGFHDGAANNYIEMGTTLGKGLLFEDFFAGKHKHDGVSIEEYAKKFKAIYNSK